MMCQKVHNGAVAKSVQRRGATKCKTSRLQKMHHGAVAKSANRHCAKKCPTARWQRVHNPDDDGGEAPICVICLDAAKPERQMLGCGHVYCGSCIARYFRTCRAEGRSLACPTCMRVATPGEAREIVGDDRSPSGPREQGQYHSLVVRYLRTLSEQRQGRQASQGPDVHRLAFDAAFERDVDRDLPFVPGLCLQLPVSGAVGGAGTRGLRRLRLSCCELGAT